MAATAGLEMSHLLGARQDPYMQGSYTQVKTLNTSDTGCIYSFLFYFIKVTCIIQSNRSKLQK